MLLAGPWRVLEIAADPFRWARSLQLLDGEGLPVLEYPQSPGRMIPATARFYEPAPQGVLGRWPAWCPTMGVDREVVSTLRGRWAGGGPVSSNSGGLTRSGGEQPAAAARPRQMRRAVR
jgi:hypothetical protein